MNELKRLEDKIEERLDEIRNIGIERKQTANELDEYVRLQSDLKQVHHVMIMIQRMESEK